MTSFISGTISVIGGCVSFVVKASFGLAFLGGAAGAALYVTKPDEKTFDSYLRNECKKSVPGFAGKALGVVISNVSSTAFTDNILFRFADISLIDGSKQRYVGVLGTWFDCGSNRPNVSQTRWLSDGTSVTTHSS